MLSSRVWIEANLLLFKIAGEMQIHRKTSVILFKVYNCLTMHTKF